MNSVHLISRDHNDKKQGQEHNGLNFLRSVEHQKNSLTGRSQLYPTYDIR